MAWQRTNMQQIPTELQAWVGDTQNKVEAEEETLASGSELQAATASSN
jgi:hypothetical protein